MTNWRVAFLCISMVLAFCGCACSLKCYKCATSSEQKCERNQTLEGCADSSFHCATAMFSQVGQDGTLFSQTYMKRCLPLPVIQSYCASLNQSSSGRLRNCSISSCDVDYCNGPTPTTTTVRTEVDTTTSEGTSQEPDTTQRGPGARAGSPSTVFTSSAVGLIMTVFALGKILDICSFSWDNPWFRCSVPPRLFLLYSLHPLFKIE